MQGWPTPEDFRFANPLVASVNSGEQRTLVWRVYDRYQTRGYMSAADSARVVREYEPLLDEPNLFLEFAALWDYTQAEDVSRDELKETLVKYTRSTAGGHRPQEDYPEIDESLIREIPEDAASKVKFRFKYAALSWIHTYGLLGLSPSDDAFRLPGTNSRVPQEYVEQIPSHLYPHFQNRVVAEYDDRGGPEESAKLFVREASRAWQILNLYTATLSRDVEKLEKLLVPDRSAQLEPGDRDFAMDHYLERACEILDIDRSARPEPGGREMDRFLERVSEIHSDILVDLATREVTYEMQIVLSRFTYPNLTFAHCDPWRQEPVLFSPQSLTASFWPRNLLGAMYLQFYWLVTSADELPQCQHCGKSFFLSSIPGSGKRKTYKNKKFCSKQCRQNHHYQTRVKPNRNSKGAENDTE